MLGIYWQIPLRRTKKKNLRRDSTGLENDLQIQRPTKIQNRPRMPASPQYQHQGEKRYLVLVFNWSWTGIWLLSLPFKWEVFSVSSISFYPFLLKFSYTLWQSTSHLSPSYPSPSSVHRQRQGKRFIFSLTCSSLFTVSRRIRRKQRRCLQMYLRTFNYN